jgi:preprotein translocase subunit SecA
MEMTKEEKDNITRLSALCAITSLYIKGCKKTIQEANIEVLKQQYKYDTLSLPNKKVIDKKIADAMKNLNLTMDTTTIVLGRIEKSMRNTLTDEVTDALIDKLDAVLDSVDLEGVLKQK